MAIQRSYQTPMASPFDAGVWRIILFAGTTAASFHKPLLLVLSILGFLGVPLSYPGALVFVYGAAQTGGAARVLLAGAALACLSQAFDTLGIWGIFLACRRADQGNTAPPPPSAAYGLPIRFFGVLIALGILAIHRSLASAFYAVLIVISLVSSRARTLLAAYGGALYGYDQPLWIPIFGSLVDWRLQIGEGLFRKDLVVAYDGKCKLCRRTAASLRTFDVFRRIDWVEAQDDSALRERGIEDADPIALVTDIHGFLGQQVLRGYETYQKIAWRIPVLWPIAPMLYLPPVANVGRRIYRRIADSRTCTIRVEPQPSSPERQVNLWPLWLALVILCLVLTVWPVPAR